ncbi:sodium:proton antiporter [Cryobacterium sp. TMT2-18-3]|uniref:monovalent cation/H+ antiporter complex subunit F n=1 Tax=unclassified Cryobacterium TaxID=2649013 RepID=UPI00106D4531|nr:MULTISPECIES: monovalent cation/H+ antiporter complex subunit F [unclassified Cryobacterium]TFC26337.1 sodium:proton antiporter [Cryobacterium sp. TMT2-18-2]TFC35342.1 sodium:proton antiporter [Cryobacterium sp. TMT2-42-4]TFC60503.1 sodium:proton antiporter [Cryobacterium sp. TMT2-15-1]TFC64483.1 sodium:proton antiporter [Cryobacterium sp. TMT2-18-3]
MHIVAVIAGVLFGAGALCALLRIVRGPTVLDRVIASDVLVATVICAMGAEMAFNRHTDTLPVLLVLALFAVLGSLSVARFLPVEDSE